MLENADYPVYDDGQNVTPLDIHIVGRWKSLDGKITLKVTDGRVYQPTKEIGYLTSPPLTWGNFSFWRHNPRAEGSYARERCVYLLVFSKNYEAVFWQRSGRKIDECPRGVFLRDKESHLGK